MSPKSWKKSITIWLNFGGIAIGVILGTLETVLPAVAMYLPGWSYAALIIGLAIANNLLRAYKTWQPLDTNAISK